MSRSDKPRKPAIAFDTWGLGRAARHHGIYVYAMELLTRFQDMAPHSPVEIMPYVCAGAENGANQFKESPGFSPQQTRLLKFSRSWRWGGAQLLAAMGEADLVFSPSCTTLYGFSVPLVATIHDLTPVLVPWGSRKITRALHFFLWWSAKFSRAIVTVSQHSKADIVGRYGLPESRVTVIYNGYDKVRFNSAAPDPELLRKTLARLGIARPYILHHGVIKPSKNLARLIQAYRLALERNPNLDVDLVLAGPLGWEYARVLEEANKTEGSRGKVVLTRALSDQDLAMLVKGASLAVVPSLYEGFCLPLVESMACGVPTIAANSSCLPEISGGRLRYFDPRSVDEMAVCMESALEDESVRRELIAKGLGRASIFDWGKCAEETLALLVRTVAEGKN